MATAGRFTAHTWFGLAVLCLAAAVNLLQSASLSPLLPRIGADFGATDAVTGQLATIGSLVGFGFSAAATPWMDRWSRGAWFRVQGSLILFGLLIAVLAPSFLWLAVGRIFAACGASLIMANCMTGAREMFPDTVWRNRAIGFIISATTLVLILGLPAIIQIEARFGWRMAMAAIMLPAILLLAGAALLPVTPRATAKPTNPLLTFRAVLGDRRIRALLIVLGLCSALYTGWFVYFGAYTTGVFAVSPGLLSLLFLLAGAVQLLANNLAPVLVRRFDPMQILHAAMSAVALALLSTGIAVVSIPGAFVAAVTVLIGTGMAYIAGNVLLLDSDIPHPGAIMSLGAATGSLGAALGPLITGVALASSGSFETAYRVLGILAPLAILTVWLGTRRQAAAAVERAA